MTEHTPKPGERKPPPATYATAETESARLTEEFASAANLYVSKVVLVASPLVEGKSIWNPLSPTESLGCVIICGAFFRESSAFQIFVQAKTPEALHEFGRLASSAGGWLARFGSTKAGPWMACDSSELDWIAWLFLSLWDSQYVEQRANGTFRVSSPFAASTYLLRLGDELKRETEAEGEPQSDEPFCPVGLDEVQQFGKRVLAIHLKLTKTISAIRQTATTSEAWLDNLQRPGLMLKDYLEHGPRTSGAILREIADADEGNLIEVNCLDGERKSAHQTVLAVAEFIGIQFNECREWELRRVPEETRLVEINDLQRLLEDINFDDLAARLDTEVSALMRLLAKPVEPQAVTLASGKGANEWQLAEAAFVFWPDGDGYYLKGFGESGHVTAKGAKGLRDLFRLVQTPGVPVPMLELDAGPGVERAEGNGQSRQPVADGEALKQLAAKRKQLKADIESAESDMERNELTAELGKLEETAKGMRGLNGKPRDINNPLDKLRPKLLKRISTAGDKLREASLDKLADHFGLTVSSEAGCLVYRPAVEGLTWNVTKL